MTNKNYVMNNNKDPMYDAAKEMEKAVEVDDEAVNVEDLVETEEPVEQEETVVGIVGGCEKLNIRKGPTKNAEVLCEVPVNAILVIDVNESTYEWYSVITESGCNGYCMKKYVTVSK